MFQEYYYQNFTPSPLSRQTGIYPCWTGTLKAAENYHCSSRTLDDYFLIYVKSGRGDLKSGAMRCRLQKNSIFFLFPGILHSYYTSKNNLLELWWVGFNGFLSSTLIRRLNLHPSNPVIDLPSESVEEVEGMLDRLIHSPDNEAPLGRSAAILSVFSMLISVSGEEEQLSHRNDDGRNDRILKALAFIDCNFTDDLSISDLADYVGMSRSAFSRLFKNETGRSPQNHLIEVRLEQSIHLLSGNMSIREVAAASGFNDEYYFSRCFRKRYSLPPNELRKKLHEIRSLNTTPDTKKTWL